MCDCCSILIKENRRLTEELIEEKVKIRDLENKIEKLKSRESIRKIKRIREEILDENKVKNLGQEKKEELEEIEELFDVKVFDFDLK